MCTYFQVSCVICFILCVFCLVASLRSTTAPLHAQGHAQAQVQACTQTDRNSAEADVETVAGMEVVAAMHINNM